MISHRAIPPAFVSPASRVGRVRLSAGGEEGVCILPGGAGPGSWARLAGEEREDRLHLVQKRGEGVGNQFQVPKGALGRRSSEQEFGWSLSGLPCSHLHWGDSCLQKGWIMWVTKLKGSWEGGWRGPREAIILGFCSVPTSSCPSSPAFYLPSHRCTPWALYSHPEAVRSLVPFPLKGLPGLVSALLPVLIRVKPCFPCLASWDQQPLGGVAEETLASHLSHVWHSCSSPGSPNVSLLDFRLLDAAEPGRPHWLSPWLVPGSGNGGGVAFKSVQLVISYCEAGQSSYKHSEKAGAWPTPLSSSEQRHRGDDCCHCTHG